MIVEVHVQPGAKRASVSLDATGHLKIAVTAPADRNKANEAVIAVLAKLFGVPRRDVELRTGHTARHKRFALEGVTSAQFAAVCAEVSSSVPR